jgi:bis(5'-nucleosidyl)-tetraphosphatase
MAAIHDTEGRGEGQPRPLAAAGVILFRRAADGAPRFLLLETRKGGHYSPPKGHLEHGESFEAGARRETLEETGLRPRALEAGFEVEIAYDVVKRGLPRRKRVVYYLGEAEPGPVILSDEHVASRWEPIETVAALVPFENLLRVFRLAAAHLAAAGKA